MLWLVRDDKLLIYELECDEEDMHESLDFFVLEVREGEHVNFDEHSLERDVDD